MSHLVISSTTKMMVGSDSPHRLLGYLLHQILPVTLEIWWSANPGYSKAPRFLVVKFLKSPFRPPNIHMPKSFHAKSTPKFHISTCFQIFPYINIFQLFFKIPTHLFPLFFHVAAPRVLQHPGLGVGAAEGRGPGHRAASDLGLRGAGERADGRTRPPRGPEAVGKMVGEMDLPSGKLTSLLKLTIYSGFSH